MTEEKLFKNDINESKNLGGKKERIKDEGRKTMAHRIEGNLFR